MAIKKNEHLGAYLSCKVFSCFPLSQCIPVSCQRRRKWSAAVSVFSLIFPVKYVSVLHAHRGDRHWVAVSHPFILTPIFVKPGLNSLKAAMPLYCLGLNHFSLIRVNANLSLVSIWSPRSSWLSQSSQTMLRWSKQSYGKLPGRSQRTGRTTETTPVEFYPDNRAIVYILKRSYGNAQGWLRRSGR